MRHHAESLNYHPTCILFLDVIIHAFTFFRYAFGFTSNVNYVTKIDFPGTFVCKVKQIAILACVRA